MSAGTKGKDTTKQNPADINKRATIIVYIVASPSESSVSVYYLFLCARPAGMISLMNLIIVVASWPLWMRTRPKYGYIHTQCRCESVQINFVFRFITVPRSRTLSTCDIDRPMCPKIWEVSCGRENKQKCVYLNPGLGAPNRVFWPVNRHVYQVTWRWTFKCDWTVAMVGHLCKYTQWYWVQ